jgi:hypothetical protein
VTPLEPATHQMVDSPHSCRVEDGMAPTTAFSRFPHVHRADVEGKQRVDLPRSPCRRAMTAICAFPPSRRRTSRSAIAQRRQRFSVCLTGVRSLTEASRIPQT